VKIAVQLPQETAARITPENDTSLPSAGYRTGTTNGNSGQAWRQRMKDEECSKTIIRINLVEAKHGQHDSAEAEA
jgi:hypothetical protein